MRHLTSLAAALALGFTATAAQALVIPIDDFTAPAITLTDAQGGGATTSGPLTGGGFTRNLSLEVLSPLGGPGGFSNIRMGNNTFPAGLLDIQNGANFDSQVIISWTVAAGFIPNTSPAQFFFDIVNSDGNPIVAELLLNGNVETTFVIAPNTLNQTRNFTLTQAETNTLSAGGTLALRINGEEGWDLILDSVGFRIPEPTTLALAGLALLGAGVASRRRKA